MKTSFVKHAVECYASVISEMYTASVFRIAATGARIWSGYTGNAPVPVAARSKAYVCGRSPAEIVGLNPTGGMNVCFECCVLSGRGLCDELITRPEESHRLWCVVVCDLENLKNEEAMTRVGSQRHSPKKKMSMQAVTLVLTIFVLNICKTSLPKQKNTTNKTNY